MRSVFYHCRRFRAWHELRGWWVHALDVAAMFGSRDTYANDLCLSEFRNKNREFIFLSRVVGACVVRYVCGERRTSSEGLKKLHFGLKWIRCAVAGLGVVVVSNSAHALNAHAFQCFESQATFMTYWNFYSRVAIESNRNHWVFWTRIDFSCGYSKWSGLRLNFTLQPSPTNRKYAFQFQSIPTPRFRSNYNNGIIMLFFFFKANLRHARRNTRVEHSVGGLGLASRFMKSPARNESAVKMFYIHPLHVYIPTFAH